MYRFLVTGRWIAGFLVLLLAAALMVRLGVWQWDRGQQKAAANDAIEVARAKDPVPAADLIPAAPNERPAPADEWSRVSVTGSYDPSGTVLIRQRSFEEGVGFEIVVPLNGDDGATYLVDRGYALASGGADEAPDIPAAPEGVVTVTGIVKTPYTTNRNATRVEQVGAYRSVRALDPQVLSESLGVPLAGGYIVATAEMDADGAAVTDIKRIPPPEFGDGPHLSYAVQWWIFAVMTLFAFGYLARREAITRLLTADDLDDPDLDDAEHGDGSRADEIRDPLADRRSAVGERGEGSAPAPPGAASTRNGEIAAQS